MRWPPPTPPTPPTSPSRRWRGPGRGGERPVDDLQTAATASAVAHLEEELGDLLFQVYFHATLAAEEGRFTLADVARGVHDKLVSRHPHVFGDVTAETADDVAANWEAIKKVEKGRASVTEGIPAALPALALAAKLQRKASAIGMVLPGLADEADRVAEGVGPPGASEETTPRWPTGRAGPTPGRPRSGTCSSPPSRWPGHWGSTPRPPCCPVRSPFRAEVEARG